MNARRRRGMLLFWAVVQALAFSLLFTTTVHADDCLSDPLNAADCMRTGTFRQGISVLTSLGGAVGVILVNTLSGWAASTAAAGAAAAASAVESSAAAAAEAAAASGGTATGTTTVSPAEKPGPSAEKGAAPPAKEPEPGMLESAQGAVGASVQSPIFNIIKTWVSSSSAIAGATTEYFAFADGEPVVNAIRQAAQAWQKNPTKEAAEEYIKAVQKARDVRLKNFAEKLDLTSKAVDVYEAIGNGLNKAKERGFTGTDKALILGAELGKKGLTWMLTKNPVVGLVDAAVGGATEMAWGKDKRVDIGGVIDKGADAWDKTTQEYFNNTQGGSAADAENQAQDQFLHLIRRIKDQVNQGKLTREQGSQRMRQIRDKMFGGG